MNSIIDYILALKPQGRYLSGAKIGKEDGREGTP
jgi:hypothetical protein